MNQHYIESVAREDPMSHKAMPLDTVHYLKRDCIDPLMDGMVCVTEWNSSRVKETITEELFDQHYSAVDMTTDPDQQIPVLPDAPIVTSPNGSQFAISVDDDGNISATPIAV